MLQPDAIDVSLCRPTMYIKALKQSYHHRQSLMCVCVVALMQVYHHRQLSSSSVCSVCVVELMQVYRHHQSVMSVCC